MIKYFTFVFIIKNTKHYSIWYSDEDDGFIIESSKIKTFCNMDEMKCYARDNNYELETEYTEMQFDTAINIATKKNIENEDINCKYLLDFWNIVSDIANSVGDVFIGDTREGTINSIYNKLFYGNNLEAIKKNGEDFIPTWNKYEKNELLNVTNDGIRILRNYL